MEYAIEYISEMRNRQQILQRINKVRLLKWLFLLFELFRVDGDQTTNMYYNNNKVSTIK